MLHNYAMQKFGKDPSNNEKGALFNTLLPLAAPWRIRKVFHFSKDDTKQIKRNLGKTMSLVSFIGGFISLLFGIFFLICINYEIWGFENVNIFMKIAAYSLIFVNAAGILCISFDFFSAKRHPAFRFAGDLVFHLSLITSYFCFFLSDLHNGDLSVSESITPAVGLLFILAICQSGYLIEAIIVDLGVGLGTIALCIVGVTQYQMRAVEQYVFFVLGFLATCYFLCSAFYYVEAQRYYIESRNTELYSRSTHDTLTGARNRAGLRFYLDERMKSWIAKETDVLVIMFDIDDFKMYNDAFGHLRGDEVLIAIVKAIENCPDLHHIRLFRYGGEEFLVLRSKTDEAEANAILESIRKAVEDLHFPVPYEGEGSYVTISLGGALWTIKEGYVFHDQVDDADKALYEAKSAGKNRFVLHTNVIEHSKEPEPPQEEETRVEEEEESKKPAPKKAPSKNKKKDA